MTPPADDEFAERARASFLRDYPMPEDAEAELALHERCIADLAAEFAAVAEQARIAALEEAAQWLDQYARESCTSPAGCRTKRCSVGRPLTQGEATMISSNDAYAKMTAHGASMYERGYRAAITEAVAHLETAARRNVDDGQRLEIETLVMTIRGVAREALEKMEQERHKRALRRILLELRSRRAIPPPPADGKPGAK